MPRSYPLRWLALALGFGLLGTQCQESLSDDCTKTLTCPDSEQPVLDENCIWRYPNSDRIWTEGPRYDEATGKWRWPDGKETATQDFNCNYLGIDAGVDGGASRRCRQTSDCDVPLVCDTATNNCVECLSSSDCAENVAIGDAGAAIACDQVRHECVPCVQDSDCTGDVPVCKKDIANSSRNECVECTADTDCGGSRPICDTTSNECTSSCTSNSQCTGEKSVCNTTTQLCVECTDNSTCSGSASQCNTTTNECVQCVDDAPCTAGGRVCDTTSNNCVQCNTDLQCMNVPNAPRCEPETNLCVECLLDTECTSDATSRCNPVSHLCVGCTEDSQCEGDRRCNVDLGGRCVQCLTSSDCPSAFPVCETSTGSCKECLTNGDCRLPDAARCETAPGLAQYTCVGCTDNVDCSGGNRNLPDLCNETTGTCVDCVLSGDCSNPSLSRCGNGVCAVCLLDGDCGGRFGGLEGCVPNQGCVECTLNQHCNDTPDTPVCKLNNNGPAAGDAAVNTCVECQSNNDCTSAGESRCVNNACVPCVGNDDCSHLSGLGVCDAGTCVQCTGTQRGACGANVCDSLAHTCTDRPAGGAGLCDDCVSDAECETGASCVQQAFAGSSGFFCFPQQANNLCTTQGFANRLTATVNSIDNAAALVCTLRQTTCAAYQAYIGGRACEDATDDATCGPEGRCELGNLGFRCTIGCISADDCTGTAPTCTADGCGL